MTFKFSIDRQEILPALQAICMVVEKKQTLPILSNVLLQTQGKTLTLTGTDLELELVTHAKCRDSSEDGGITVPARKLLDICRNLPNDAVCKFQLKGNRLTLATDQSKFTLSTQPAAEYPNIDVGDIQSEIQIAEGELKYLLEKTYFAMAQQDVRYYLNGILIEISQNQLTAVATDGHRLAVSHCQLPYDTKQQSSIIIPRKGIVELIKLLDNGDNDVKCEIGNNFIRFSLNSLVLTSKLIEGKFPNYKMVIPKNGDKTVIINRDHLKSALSRAAILSHEKHHGIRAEITDKIQKIFAMNAESEESEEELPINFVGSNGLEIGLNVNYLQDVLAVIPSNEVKMIFSDSNSSILIEANDANNDSIYVIMPMRL